MTKKIIATILSSILMISAVGCSNKAPKNEETAPMAVEEKVALPGIWSTDYSRDEVMKLHKEILRRVEDVAAGYYLEYDLKEEIKEENGVTINNNNIYLDIEEPEANRLESMYYGFKQYGSDLASGDLSMKIGFNLDKKLIKEAGEFNFEETSICSFSEAFTDEYDRDYTDLNEKLYNMIVGNDNVESIENNLDGLRETITITENYLLYKLETKEYKFK